LWRRICGALAERKPQGRVTMAIDPRVREALNRKGIELVRARYIKEMAVTGDTDQEMKKEIQFGDQKIRVNDLAEWLEEEAQNNSWWTKATGRAAVVAAFFAVLAFVIAVLAWVFPMG
jgi:hypothetical protein